MYCQVRSCACWSGENTKAVLRSIRKHLSLKTCISQLIVTFCNSIDWFRHDNRFYWKIFNYIFSMSLVIIANLKRIQIIRKGFSANFEQPFVSNMLEVLEETKNLSFFFLSGFSSQTQYYSQDSRGRQRTIFYSTLPLPPAHEHWDTYLQLCMWDDYHVFLIATLLYTRLLLDEIYHLIELPFEWLV